MALSPDVAAWIFRVIVLLLGSFYGTFVAIYLLFKCLCNPISFFRKKNRTAPPSGLCDPRYGEHHKFKLKDGRLLHYVAKGKSGSRLAVLVHGYPESWWSWRHQLTALADEYYTVAMSLPGYGESDSATDKERYRVKNVAEDIKELIEHLGQKEAVVIGHDWGASISWEFAYRYPEMVHRLIVIDSAPGPVYARRLFSSVQFFRSWYFFVNLMPFIPELVMENNDMEFFDHIFTSEQCGIPNRDVLSAEDLECLKYYFAKRSFKEPLEYYRQAMSYSAYADGMKEREQRMRFRIKAKTLILWGKKDRFVDVSLAHASARVCDDAKVIIFENGSHWLQQHEPVAVNNAILEFLRDQ